MPETKFSGKKISESINEIQDDLHIILEHVEKKIDSGNIETMVDVKALFDKIQYATYGADSTALVYAAYKYILKHKDDALHEIQNE